MYHNLIPRNQRSQYLDLLSKAEKLLPSLLAHPEFLPIVIEAASAVRGSEEVLARIKNPLNAQHITLLATLLTKSRTYVRNFWDEPQEAQHNPVITTSRHNATTPNQPTKPTGSQRVNSSTVPSVAVPQQPLAPCPLPLAPDSLRQYITTLSPKLQHQASVVHAKYAELNDLHETLDRLARAQLSTVNPQLSNSTQRELSYYAKRIDLISRTIDAFWNRVHAERQAQAGQPVTKEYQAYLDEEEKKYPMEEEVNRKWGDYSKAEIEQLELSHQNPNTPIFPNQPDSPTIAQLVFARQERNKKLIRRAPQHPTEKAKQERILAMNELHEWNIPIEKKQWEVLQSMGIEVPKDFLNPFLTMTDEEKKAHKKTYDHARYEDNKPLEVKLNVKRNMKKSKKEDNPYLKK